MQTGKIRVTLGASRTSIFFKAIFRKSTKDNPGTLPISAYGRRTLGNNPLNSLDEMRHNVIGDEDALVVDGEEEEDISINENFDGGSSGDNNEAESDLVFIKDSVVLISQDDRVSGPFLLGKLTRDWQRSSKEAARTHVYAPDSEDCLLFHYEFTGVISGDKILGQVDSDMLLYLDEDFHIEINDEFYHQCLSCAYANEEELSTKQAATDSVRRSTSSGRTLTLPHRYR